MNRPLKTGPIPFYQFSVLKNIAKFHFKMQILERKTIQFSFFNLIFAICNTPFLSI